MTSNKELKRTLKTCRIKDLDKMMRNLRKRRRKPYLKGTGSGSVKLDFE